MRVAVVADVHANLPALRAALAMLDEAGYDRLVCAGDLVGYGASPNECVGLIAEAAVACVAGNHDLIALGLLSPERCVPTARSTLAWTAEVLGSAERDYLAALPGRADLGELVVAHGSLDDPEAPTRARQAAAVAQALEREHPQARVLALGHTHEPGGWDTAGGPIERPGPSPLPAPRCIVNPGAVGQTRSRLSREPRPLARALVIDLGAGSATWLATPYPLAPVRRALRAAGLPARTYRQAAPLWKAVAARLERRRG